MKTVNVWFGLMLSIVVVTGAHEAVAQSDSTTSRRRFFELTEDTTGIAGLFEIERVRDAFVYALGGGISITTGSFTGIDGVPSCCPEYTNAVGPAGIFTIEYRRVLTPDWEVGLGASGAFERAPFLAEEPTSVVVSGELADATISHELTIDRGSVVIDAAAYWIPSERWRILTGPRVSIALAANAEQKETIAAAGGDVVFAEENSGARNQYSGSLPSMNRVQFGWRLGAEMQIPVSRDMLSMVIPRLTYAITPTDPAAGVAVVNHQILFSVAVSMPLTTYYENVRQAGQP